MSKGSAAGAAPLVAGHTPGPWEVSEDGWAVKASDSILANIVCVAPEELYRSMEYWPANRRLIAAAPDLLEACERVREVCGHGDLVDAAIAKAKGETP